RVVPRPPAVGAPRGPARPVAAAVVVVARDDLVRVVRVDRDRRLVLSLAAALEIRVGQVQAVLVDLDVRADVGRTVAAAAREVLVRPVGRAVVVVRLPELERGEAGDQPLLLVVHLVVDPEPAAAGRLDAGDAATAPDESERRHQRDDREEDPKEPLHLSSPFSAPTPGAGAAGILFPRDEECK